MAEFLLSALVNDVLRRLTSTAIQELGRLWRLEDDVLALKETYTHILSVLNDAEKKQKEQEDVQTWLKSLRSASLEVENVLDLVLTEAMLQRLHNRRLTKHKVRAFFSSDRNPLMVHTRIANKVKTIRRRLDRIAANKSNFNLISDPTSMDVGVGSETTKIKTTSLQLMSVVYGRDAEMEMVMQKICSKDKVRHETEGVLVYAIWGIGGVGKTTLAQLVYNHEKVRAHFDLRSWIYVSSEFNIEKLTIDVIESIDKSQCQLPRLDDMQVYLQEKLKGKRFLIVLDDIWIEESVKWDELSKALSGGAEGSIVMVTTRNQTTSNMMAKVVGFHHEVGCLSEEESWSLFKKLAFGSEREEGNVKELESIGKEIVDKCKGLPLAVKTLGGLMHSKRSVSEWKSVNESDVWELQENGILSSLKLSYDNLLPHLKRCFTYCCLFPKGYEMDKDILMELWMANGFVPGRGEVDLYVIAEEVFNCLVSRSFIQGEQGKHSKNLVYKMHDLMHDLARYVTRHDCSIIKRGKKLTTADELLHVSSSCLDSSFLDEDSKRLRSLRSIFIFGEVKYPKNITQISRHLCIRVLHLDGMKEPTLPKSVCELKHLRYLSLSGSLICVLPESIIYLQNLEVLLVQDCVWLYKLSEGMRYMKNLRCLNNQGCEYLHYMPSGMKELTNLRRLGRFFVGKERGARIGELGDLNLLGWGLELGGLENVEGLEDAKSANLQSKKNLMTLGLCWSENDRFESEERLCRQNEEVLEGLEPNSSLTELRIRLYMGKVITPNWMMNLRNLVKVVFLECRRCESIPSLGELPCLKFISVRDMDALIRFDDERLPSLQELAIYDCPRLSSLPSNFLKLKELTICRCPLLQRLPAGNLKELTSLRIWESEILERKCGGRWGEEWPKISHVLHLDVVGLSDRMFASMSVLRSFMDGASSSS